MRILLFVLLIFSVDYAFGASFSVPLSVSVTGTSTQALAINQSRSYLIIQNTGLNAIIVKFGSVQSANEGIIIPAGGNYEPYNAPINSVWLKETAGVSTAVIIQGQ